MNRVSFALGVLGAQGVNQCVEFGVVELLHSADVLDQQFFRQQLDCEPQPFDRLLDTQDCNYIFAVRGEVLRVRIKNVFMQPVTTAFWSAGIAWLEFCH